jgi:hypothetical protein
VTIPNITGAADTFVMNGVTATLTGKTLTAPVITTPTVSGMILSDGHENLTISVANQTDSGATATIPDIGDSADSFVMNNTIATLTLKTLTTPVIASFCQDAGKTKVMTTPDTASDTLVTLAATQTLTNKQLTSPKINEAVACAVTSTQLNRVNYAPRMAYLGTPALGGVNDIVTIATMKNTTTYVIAASPDVPRVITISHTANGAPDTLGTIEITGTDYADAVITETITPLNGTIATGLKAFKTVTSAIGTGWSANEGADQITIGTGPALGMPFITSGFTGASAAILFGGIFEAQGGAPGAGTDIATSTITCTTALNASPVAVLTTV